LSKTVQLQAFHEEKGHLTEFAGFTLPLWFKGIIPEALAVRNAAGLFDVSHMGRAIVEGRDSQKLLDHLWTNDVSSLKLGQGHYSLICNPDGGIKDDGLVFRLKDEEYLIVYNAGNREKDLQWIQANSAGFTAKITDISDDVAMFAVQGPKARQITQSLSNSNILGVPRFGCAWSEINGSRVLVSRTGYTGEDGFEVFVWDATVSDPTKARVVWNKLLEAGGPVGLEPCGLGARDLVRLEAGLCLYGTDMDETTNPFEARLGFVVKLNKKFIGCEKLKAVKASGTPRVRAGLVTERRVIPRHGFTIIRDGRQVGTVTSGSLSPLLNTGIAMGYVEKGVAEEGAFVEVRVRDRNEMAKIVKPPFYDTTRFGYARTC